MRKKNTQESEDEWWARLDKRIERARARHELARLGMGTIFLVIFSRIKIHFKSMYLYYPLKSQVFVLYVIEVLLDKYIYRCENTSNTVKVNTGFN